MFTTSPHNPAIWSYGVAALIFGGLILYSLVHRHSGIRGNLHLTTGFLGILWSLTNLQTASQAGVGDWSWAARLDTLRILCWFAFSLLMLESPGTRAEVKRGSVLARPWFVVPVILAGVLALITPAAPPVATLSGDTLALGFHASLLLSIAGLFIAEQFLVSTVRSRWWAVKPFCLGFGAMMAFDLVYFAGGVLFRHVDIDLWSARGMVHGLSAVLIAVSASRLDGWRAEIHFSQNAVIQFSSFVLVGIFLILISAAGYWVAWFGGDWGGTLRVAFTFGALLSLLLLAFSGRLRSRLKVFLSKHLLSYRYDYRNEWTRFTHQFGQRIPGETQRQQVIRALADLVESTGGQLWEREDREFKQTDTLDAPLSSIREAVDSPLMRFLESRNWVVEIDREAVRFGLPDGFEPPAWLADNSRAWLLVPLVSGNELHGFAVLNPSKASFDVNWEVRDILKTAAAQVAAYLSETRAKAQLVETEQFDAFNRLSAYVVHDLKNLITQLDLLTRNAERHRDNPEFQADLLETVKHAVSRMQQLMLQLRSGAVPAEPAMRIELSALLSRVAREKSQGGINIHCDIGSDIHARGHADRMERVIGHLLQNAIEATGDRADGIGVRLTSVDGAVVLEVSDSGVGMSEAFIRDRLFHPFQTTKQSGMGIGVYESDRYVRSLGGRMTVRSTPFAGTTFQVHLPQAKSMPEDGEAH